MTIEDYENNSEWIQCMRKVLQDFTRNELELLCVVQMATIAKLVKGRPIDHELTGTTVDEIVDRLNMEYERVKTLTLQG